MGVLETLYTRLIFETCANNLFRRFDVQYTHYRVGIAFSSI